MGYNCHYYPINFEPPPMDLEAVAMHLQANGNGLIMALDLVKCTDCGELHVQHFQFAVTDILEKDKSFELLEQSGGLYNDSDEY